MLYYKQLDGLRAIAVTAVIAHHWIDVNGYLGNIIHFGAHGVSLFFIISGFLITNILLTQRDSNLSLFGRFKVFYFRRALRIFPIYFLYLLIVFYIFWSDIKPNALFLITYLFNLDIFFNGWPTVPTIHHLWSLSVEEQFYLIWPFILLLINSKYHIPSLIIIFSCSFLSSVYFYFKNYNSIDIFSGYAFMSLVMGAFLAIHRSNKKQFSFHYLVIFGSLIAYILLKASFIPHFTGRSFLGYLIPWPSIAFLFIIYKSITGFKGAAIKVLENPIIVYLGKISYGLYLYHMLIPYFFNSNSFWYKLLFFAILIIVSSFSWYLIERPINNLKKYYIYS